MTDLASRVEAGTATDEEVALTLGWSQQWREQFVKATGGTTRFTVWVRFDGTELKFTDPLPSFTTSLHALADSLAQKEPRP